jgi:hypothetical protein
MRTLDAALDMEAVWPGSAFPSPMQAAVNLPTAIHLHPICTDDAALHVVQIPVVRPLETLYHSIQLRSYRPVPEC